MLHLTNMGFSNGGRQTLNDTLPGQTPELVSPNNPKTRFNGDNYEY
jgi:hypothetical protein